jgi:hypothetical protein
MNQAAAPPIKPAMTPTNAVNPADRPIPANTGTNPRAKPNDMKWIKPFPNRVWASDSASFRCSSGGLVG